MLPLDYVHALCLVGIALYIWQREPPRLLLTPLMLLGFFVLYGFGNLVYFADADTVLAIRNVVTVCLILMWIGLVVGIELARASMPALAGQSQRVVRAWSTLPLADRARTDQLLAGLGVLVALFILAMFFGMGKPGQILSFLAFQSAKEKIKLRLEFGGQGG